MKEKINTKIKSILKEAKNTFKSIITKKEEGVKAIIVEIILIVVAAAVCILFKDQILSLLGDLLGEISTRVKGVFN